MERLAPGFLHEHVTPGSEIWLDGGHNPAGGEAIASTLADLDERSPRPIHLIVGMLKTKDAGSFLRHFAGLPELTTTIAIPNQKNSYSADELGAIALKEGLRASAASSLEAALAMSRRAAREPVRIVIVGSLYLAGEVLTLHEGRAG
jgi:dihydrofolate synthase/folylpolyglutamate synthase